MPASTLPAGVLGARILNETYSESGLLRQMTALKIMYGVGTRFTLIASVSGTNYHSKDLPLDFLQHNHSGVGPTVTANVPKPVPYPYRFDGVDIYAQIRVFSTDGINRHFRMAAYGEASKVSLTSHLAEPDLLFHNSGIGGGIISTYLIHHFAATFTTGFILPQPFDGYSYDNYGGVYPTKITYGNAAIYNLALGYLLYPSHYKNYRQTNINVYIEFLGKSYGSATVSQQDGVDYRAVPNNLAILKAASYLDANPGIQFILRSNMRIEASADLKLLNQSHIHTYPIYILAMQRYFYPAKRKNTDMSKD